MNRGDCVNTNINIIRGTTNAFGVRIESSDGEPYMLQSGEKIIFGVKLNTENSDYDIVKTVTVADYTDGAYNINLAPEDTAGLNFGRYYYDVGVQTADGDYYMIIPCSEFNVLENVTEREVSA